MPFIRVLKNDVQYIQSGSKNENVNLFLQVPQVPRERAKSFTPTGLADSTSIGSASSDMGRFNQQVQSYQQEIALTVSFFQILLVRAL